ncbi:hypothetical protein ACWGSE_04795 [Streptomyces diastaticus]|uniref:hypothetical protein n=1 Tax=Streptomyces diastaticus TaxID=1956 RepID=UPI0035DAE2BE
MVGFEFLAAMEEVVDVAVPYLICFTMLGVGVSLIFNLFGIREFLTGKGALFSDLWHVSLDSSVEFGA